MPAPFWRREKDLNGLAGGDRLSVVRNVARPVLAPRRPVLVPTGTRRRLCELPGGSASRGSPSPACSSGVGTPCGNSHEAGLAASVLRTFRPHPASAVRRELIPFDCNAGGLENEVRLSMRGSVPALRPLRWRSRSRCLAVRLSRKNLDHGRISPETIPRVSPSLYS